MATPRNIEIFNQVVARILDRLYREFPSPIGLDVNSIGEEVSDILDSDDEETYRILLSDAEHAMRFLAKEGFVEFNHGRGLLSAPSSIFSASVLTLKGLTIMGLTPETLDAAIERRPIAEQLSEALNEGATATVSELVKKLFMGALTVGVTAIIGGG